MQTHSDHETASLIATISPRAAEFLAHPDLGIRLLGGAIWTGAALSWAAMMVTAILTAPTAVCWLIQLAGDYVWGR